MTTAVRDDRTPAVVEALVYEGILAGARAAQAAYVVDRVLSERRPSASRGKRRLLVAAGHAALAAALVAGQVAVFHDGSALLGYLLTWLVGVGSFVGYVVRPAWPWLAAAVVAVTLVVPEMVMDLTDGTLGTPGGLLLTGMALMSSVLIAVRLQEEHSR